MICPACGLNNLENARRCARCQNTLGATAGAPAAERTPPRAKSRPRWATLRQAWKRRRGFVWPEYPRATAVAAEPTWMARLLASAALMVFAGYLLPSYQQFRLGRRRRGAVFLVLYLSAWLGLIVLMGTPYWRYWVLLMALAQTWSISDALQQPGASTAQTLLIGASSSLLFFVIAFTNHFLLNRTMAAAGWEAIPGYYATGDLRAGMIVSVRPQKQYQPGDIVAVDFGYAPGIQVVSTFDRVLAAGKHTVDITGQHVYIDGRNAEIRPLNRDWAGMNWRPFTMQDHEILVLASWLHIHADVNENIYLEQITAIRPNLPPERVRGKAVIRFPLWHRQPPQE